MWLFLGILQAFLFIAVRSDAKEEPAQCDLVALGTCAHPVVVPVALAQELLNKTITESRTSLCDGIDRDGFAKLVSCASDDEACANEIFDEEDPNNITRLISPFLKDQYITGDEDSTQDEVMKLLYDIVCDDTCVEFLEESENEETAENGEDENPIPATCLDEATNVQDELTRLMQAAGVADPNDLDLTADELKPFCDLSVASGVCNMNYQLGSMASCATLSNALDAEKINQIFVAPSLQGTPLLGQCTDYEQRVIEGFLNTSSAGHLKYSSLVIATVLAALFFQW